MQSVVHTGIVLMMRVSKTRYDAVANTQFAGVDENETRKYIG
jgi:hypothetical protein